MKSLSLIMPYYMNPRMLAHQYGVWREYDERAKSRIEIIIVDDGSPVEAAVEVPRPEGLPKLRIYRVTEDRPWHQHGARNLGAHVAESQWLFLTDMDHVLPPMSLLALLSYQSQKRALIFPRVDWPSMRPTMGRTGFPKPHPNTYAMTRELYWQIGGYDEDYCGIYGTDGLFRSRLENVSKVKLASDVPIIRFSREVLVDASTRTMPRKEGRSPGAKKAIWMKKKAEGREDQVTTLNFPWTQVH